MAPNWCQTASPVSLFYIHPKVQSRLHFSHLAIKRDELYTFRSMESQTVIRRRIGGQVGIRRSVPGRFAGLSCLLPPITDHFPAIIQPELLRSIYDGKSTGDHKPPIKQTYCRQPAEFTGITVGSKALASSA